MNKASALILTILIVVASSGCISPPILDDGSRDNEVDTLETMGASEGGMELLARERAGEIFRDRLRGRGFKIAGLDISEFEVLRYDDPSIGFIRNHSIYLIAYDLRLAGHLEVAVGVGRDRAVFTLPSEFNKMIVREGLMVDEGLALNLSRLYITLARFTLAPFDSMPLILDSASDIPWGPGYHPEALQSPAEYMGVIRPPRVFEREGGWRVEVYSWSMVGGVVERWMFEVNRDGEMEVRSETLGSNVGECLWQL